MKFPNSSEIISVRRREVQTYLKFQVGVIRRVVSVFIIERSLAKSHRLTNSFPLFFTCYHVQEHMLGMLAGLPEPFLVIPSDFSKIFPKLLLAESYMSPFREISLAFPGILSMILSIFNSVTSTRDLHKISP